MEIVGLCKSALRWLNNLFDQGVYKYNNVVKCIEGKSFGFITLRQRCPNTELFLVLIFPHSDWIRRDASYLSVFSPNAGKADQNNSEYGQFLRSDGLQRNIRPISYCLFIGKTLNVLFTMRCLNFLLKIIWFSKTNQNLDLTRLIPDLCCEFWKKCFG